MYTNITPDPYRVPASVLHKHQYNPNRRIRVNTGGTHVKYTPHVDRNNPQLNIIAQDTVFRNKVILRKS